MKPIIMTEIEKIIERFKRTHFGTCWTGESYESILSKVDVEKINEEIPGFSNTIHQIVRHLIITDELIIERLNGRNVEFSQEKNWSDKNKLKDISWTETLRDLDFYRKQVIEEISKLNDKNLEEIPFENFSPWYIQLNGLIEHLQYHMAQINLITIFQKNCR